MASCRSSNSAIKYIYELPYAVVSNICRLLDLDERWKDIGGQYFDVMTLEEFKRAIYRGDSPSQAMLTRWGQRNGTINKLFIDLYKIQYRRVMEILKPYVSPKYHYLLEDNSTTQFFNSELSSLNRYSKSKMNSSRPMEVSHHRGIPCNSVNVPVQNPSTYSGYHYMSHEQSYRKPSFDPKREPVEAHFYQNHYSHPSDPYMSHEDCYKKTSFDREKEPVEANIPSDCVLSSPVKDSSNSLSKLNGEFETSSRYGKVSMSSKQSLYYLKEQNSKQAYCMGNQRDPKSSFDSRNDSPPSYHSKANARSYLPPYPSREGPRDSFPPPYSHKGSPKENLPLPPKKHSDENHNVKDALAKRKTSGADAPQSFPSYSVVPQVTYKELQEATQDFNSTVLGRGGFGVVYKGKWRNTDVAIKKIEKKENPGSTNMEDAKLQQSLVELKTLESIRHDNILNLYGYYLNDNILCLIYQLMDSSLEDRLLMKDPSKPRLTWFDRCKIARGASCGIQFLHSNSERPLIHGDIKSANILLDKNLEPKIGDFGLVREGPNDEKTHTYVYHVNGTRQYLPHEYLREHKLSTKVDTYSFGMVLFEIATGRRAFDPDPSSNRPRYLIHYFHSPKKEKIDHLCDPNGGEKFQHLFQTFVHQGQICTSPDKADRPEMSQVYQIFETSLLVLEVVMKSNKATLMQKLDRPETSPLERQIINQMIHYQPNYNQQGPPKQVAARERPPAQAYEHRQPPLVRPPPPPQYQNRRIPVQQTELNPAASYQYQENVVQGPEVRSSNEKPPSYAEVINEYQVPSFTPPPQSSYCPPSANPLQDYRKQGEMKEAMDAQYLPKLTEMGFKDEQVPERTNNKVLSTSDSQQVKHPKFCSTIPQSATPCTAESNEDSKMCINMKPPLSSKGKSLLFLSDVDNEKPVTEKPPVGAYQQPPSIRVPPNPQYQNTSIPLQQKDVACAPEDQGNIRQPFQALGDRPPIVKPSSYAEVTNEYEVPSFAPPPLSSYCLPSTNPLPDYVKQAEKKESPDLSYLPNLTEMGFKDEDDDPVLLKNEVSGTSDLQVINTSKPSSSTPEQGPLRTSELSEDSKECICMDPPLSSKGKSLLLLSDEDDVNNSTLSDLMKNVII